MLVAKYGSAAPGEYQPAANNGEDRRKYRRAHAGRERPMRVLQKRERTEEAEAQKGQAKEAQDDGTELGRRSHKLFYHSGFGGRVTPLHDMRKS